MRESKPLQTPPKASLVMLIHPASLAVLLRMPKCGQLTTLTTPPRKGRGSEGKGETVNWLLLATRLLKSFFKRSELPILADGGCPHKRPIPNGSACLTSQLSISEFGTSLLLAGATDLQRVPEKKQNQRGYVRKVMHQKKMIDIFFHDPDGKPPSAYTLLLKS